MSGQALDADATPAPPRVTCAMRAPAVVRIGQAVPLTVALHNRSATRVAVLNWGTPFEDAWLQPFVRVRRGNAEVPYGGAMVKRGDPEFDEYFSLAPNERREATIELTLAFELKQPGRYTVVPQLVLHDLATLPVSLPRARTQHRPYTLACRLVTVTVTNP